MARGWWTALALAVCTGRLAHPRPISPALLRPLTALETEIRVGVGKVRPLALAVAITLHLPSPTSRLDGPKEGADK